MSGNDFPSLTGGGQQRVLNVRSDPPDIRDRMYEPALIRLKPEIDCREHATVLNQGTEGACTGFGLAAVVNLFNRAAGSTEFLASQRMLYEMAKKHDEWPGEDYAGSSCRGAIRGFKNMGVCSDQLWPYVANDSKGMLTIPRAREARGNTLGAYYRLRPEISDYHAALNETGAIYVSARVHDGWSRPQGRGELRQIVPSSPPKGGHAFAIVGYTGEGFIVQNSWGRRWGSEGFALWLYEDWVENIKDGWVFRLALPTPRIFGLTPPSARAGEAGLVARAPKRLEIAGHFVHFDDGRYAERGDYWSTREDVEQTADQLASLAREGKYQHLVVYAHGGLNSPKASAQRIAALKEGFKRNGVYPFHIMYDTGLAEEIMDVVKRALGLSEERAEGFIDWITEKVSDRTDTLIEDAVRVPVTPLWNEMKRDARQPFDPKTAGGEGDGMHVIRTFANRLAGTGMSIHLAGHSTGGVLLGHLLAALDALGRPDLVKTCSLMAPACTVDFYREHYQPRLGTGGGAGTVTRLPKLTVYNLVDELEKDDNVAAAYRKSLLYLVSRALERARDKPLLGMEKYSKRTRGRVRPKFVYSNGRSGLSRSRSHGGFDNDVYTMNDILKTILSARPAHPFTAEEMGGY
jgi:hypothetical protein